MNMDEESKAVAEVAKATGKGIDAVRDLGGAITRYVGGTIEQAMGVFEDNLKYYRWERQVRLIDRANSFLAARGLEKGTRTVPLPLAIPLLQGASLEENDWMQDKWAALLANAADAMHGVEIRRAYISILEDLTPLDAINLEKIYGTDDGLNVETGVFTTFLPNYVPENQPEGEDLRPTPEVEISLGNLARLGLITTTVSWNGFAIFSCVHRTVLGQSFMQSIRSAEN